MKMKIVEIFKQLKSTTSKKEKEQILKDNSDNEILKEIALYAYDKINKTYGVKKYTQQYYGGKKTIEEDFQEVVVVLLDKLASRELTGNKAIETVEMIREQYTEEDAEILDAILDRDWGCGLSESTINKAWKNHIPTFDVVLAKAFEGTDKQIKSLDDGTWYISQKIDGCRCIAINSNDEWRFWSRQGKEFFTLDVLAEDLDNLGFPDNVVLDGEICLVDENGMEDFQGVMKEIRKKDHTISNPKYKVFDILSTDEFYNKESKRDLTTRSNDLKSFIPNPTDNVEILEQEVYTPETFAKWQTRSSGNNWEGLMLRKDTGYVGKRTNDLLKVKQMHDSEYTVESVETGKVSYQESGKGMVEYDVITAVNIRHKGNVVGVGSGFSKEQRIHYFRNQDELIGKTICVQFFEETESTNGLKSLRFPVIKHIYENGRDV